jgi:hypothetical protein
LRVNGLCPKCGKRMGDYGVFRAGCLSEAGEVCCDRVPDWKRTKWMRRNLERWAHEDHPSLF